MKSKFIFYFLIFIGIIISCNLQGQYNPATVARYDYSHGSASYQSSWLGFEGNPTSLTLEGSGVDYLYNKWGFAGRLELEKFALSRSITGHVAYAYNVIEKGQTLALGIAPMIDFNYFDSGETTLNLESLLSYGLNIGAYYSTTAPTEFTDSHLFIGSSLNIYNQKETTNQDLIRISQNASLGYRLWAADDFYIQTEIGAQLQFQPMKLESYSLNIELQKMDLSRNSRTNGFCFSTGLRVHKHIPQNIDLFQNSQADIGFGLLFRQSGGSILKIGTDIAFSIIKYNQVPSNQIILKAEYFIF